ncbi:M56 family metallopeptidase [Mycobacterium sp. MMS18-G62]
MSIAVCLLLYSVVVLIGGPPLLRRLTSFGHAPRLGATAWITAIASVVVSWLGATALAVADVAHHWIHPGAAIAACLSILGDLAAGNAGKAMQVVLFVLVGLGAALFAYSTTRLLRILIRMRARTDGHARAVHVVGRRVRGVDAVVIDAPEPAAYCVPGRPHVVVVTSAALASLGEGELAAILAHERAHIEGRHPQIIAILRSLAATFPKLTLMIEGAQQVSRLLEMCADDTAAKKHGSASLIGGLLALTRAAPAPFGALGASGIAVLDRAERLVMARDAGFGRMALTITVIAIVAGGPLTTALLAAWGVLLCGI